MRNQLPLTKSQTLSVTWTSPVFRWLQYFVTFLPCNAFNFFAESFERLLQFVSQFSFSLFSRKIVSVVHVLVLAQVSRDLAHFSVELQKYFLIKFIITDIFTRKTIYIYFRTTKHVQSGSEYLDTGSTKRAFSTLLNLCYNQFLRV